MLVRLSLLLSLTAFGRALASDLVVSTTVDELDGSCTDGDCSFRDAISVSQSGDRILVPIGNFTLTADCGSGQLCGQLTIDRTLTILGAGAAVTIIQADQNPSTAPFRVMEVTAGSVAVTGVTFRHGSGVSQGAGIKNTATLTLSSCVIANNLAFGFNPVDGQEGTPAMGGGIENGGTLLVNACTIDGNVARGEQGDFSGGSGGDGLGGGIHN